MIKSRIHAIFPDDKIIAEESFKPDEPRSLEDGWIVDPLDGTTNFSHKIWPFGVSIAYLHQGQPVVGAVYDPVMKTLYTGLKGQGAYANGRRTTVNATTSLSKSTIVTTPLPPPRKLMGVKTTIRRLGSSAIDVVNAVRPNGYVAVCEKGKASSWDIAAAMVILQEAGGKITDLKGKPLDLNQEKLS